MKKLVIFDMDGTLADTSPGIINCHKHAHLFMGREEPTEQELRDVIGGPLLKTYETCFAFSPEDARKAVDAYRARYAERGIHEAELYDGIADLLRVLKQRGILLGVATLKAERFAKVMLAEMGVADLFDIICGVDEKDSRTKVQLIEMCCRQMGVSTDETVMVGDSIHDSNGAKEAGVDFIGVTYGFGFTGEDAGEQLVLCHRPDEILQMVHNKYFIGTL